MLNTRLKILSTNKKEITWSSPIENLKARKNKNLETLSQAGYKTVNDLLWLIPRKIETIPGVKSFSFAEEGKTFKGVGKLVQIQSRMNFYAKGKGKAPLYNINATIKDLNSENVISLKWFNCYPNVQKKLKV